MKIAPLALITLSCLVVTGRPALSSETYTANVIKVADGDTVTIGGGKKLRLCGIDAPEKAQEFGPEAKRRLTELTRGPVAILEIERDRYGRTVAELRGDQQLDINATMVNEGLAYHYEKYSRKCSNRQALIDGEASAKRAKIGVWSGNYQRPEEFRHGGKGKKRAGADGSDRNLTLNLAVIGVMGVGIAGLWFVAGSRLFRH